MVQCPSSNAPPASKSKDSLWDHVEVIERAASGGGTLIWRCGYCNGKFTSSYTRLRCHLLKIGGRGIGVCEGATAEELAFLLKLDEDSKKKKSDNAPKKVPLPPLSSNVSSMGSSESFDSKKRKACGSLANAFNNGAREQLDAEIARMFYSAGLPFNLARNPYFKSAFQYATNNSIPGYVPPGYNKLRTTLLQKERAHIDNLLGQTRAMWSDKGVTIVSDGWSDSQRRPLINFIAVADGQPMFLKAVDCSGETKDKYFIANLLKNVINDIGYEKIVQVITDNAPNCKGAGQLIESEFPNIVWNPCVVHTLNLALKNICAAKNMENNLVTYEECCWISDVVKECVDIKNFIMNHSMRLSMFNEFVSLKLLSVAETRFASSIVMLRRFKLIKGGLQAMVISDKWSCYKEDNLGSASNVKQILLCDEWWDSLDYILSFTRPMYDMLRACDTDKPCLHLVYDMWDTMIEDVKKAIYQHEGKRDDEASFFYDVVFEILVDRWNKNNTPLHCMAHSLNPRYYSEEWLNEDSNRVGPHKDAEISNGRSKCIKKNYPSLEDRNKLNMEYVNFIQKGGDFSDFDSISNRYGMGPKEWWLLYGSSAPMLQSIALRLLAQPSSSSCAERNWSTYSFIHSMRRNRMTPPRAQDLVFIHSNLRLLSRRTPEYTQGETKMWDIEGDAFDTFEDVGGLDMANLSLDEPELESILFENDGDEM